MEEGVADARVVRLLELSEFCSMQTQTTVIGEPGVPELPGPGAWFSYSVGVDADGSLDIALPDGGTWFNMKMDTPLSVQGPYSFQPKISGGTEISPLLLVPNVDSCCATDADCSDGDPCTAHTCIEGACVAQSEGCDDGDPCTDNACPEVGGECVTEPSCCESNGDCDDGDSCTTDSCFAGACLYDYVCCTSDAQCNDGEYCTIDSCIDGACVQQPAVLPGCCSPEIESQSNSREVL